jgi:tRNA1(Val) A37 N6-methylase TrmN6
MASHHNDSLFSIDVLPNRLILKQPKDGFRSGSDALLLASSMEFKSKSCVLDVGSGSGAVALSILKNNPTLKATGFELQTDYAELSLENSQLNDLAHRFETVIGDIKNIHTFFAPDSFDYVVTNPPFYDSKNCRPALSDAKRLAHASDIGFQEWLRLCIHPLKNSGFISVICRTERLAEIYHTLYHRCGNFMIKPIITSSNQEAKRVIVTAQKGKKPITKIKI